MPASRRARAITLAPRSWPSSPGFATSTRILRSLVISNSLPTVEPEILPFSVENACDEQIGWRKSQVFSQSKRSGFGRARLLRFNDSLGRLFLLNRLLGCHHVFQFKASP